MIDKNIDNKAVFEKQIRIDLLISLLLVGATLAIYYQLRHYSFINFDDDVYVANNPFIKSGLITCPAGFGRKNLMPPM